MKAIILAAGEGKRLRPLTNNKPKCLLSYKKITILERLINQIKKYNVNQIFVVVGFKKDAVLNKIKYLKDIEIIINDRYKDDVNIYSMFLALNKIIETGIDDVVVFESDMIAEDEFINYVLGTDFEKKSVWFTRGKFQKHQNGGILKTDGKGNIIDLKIVKKFKKNYENYDKLSGVMRIAPKELKKFYDLIYKYKKITLKQYYLMPWIQNLNELPCEKGDASHYIYHTFNTLEDYKKTKTINFNKLPEERKVYLKEVDKLHPIEEHDKNRVFFIKDKIIKDGFWKRPLRIEKNYQLVLDGHHSLALAKHMNLKYVPVIGFDYTEVEMWSLREEIKVDRNIVIKKAISGEIYPYKTVKHKFPNVEWNCNVSLKELK